MSNSTPREAAEAHAEACRATLGRGKMPVYVGPSLVRADLCKADLMGGNFEGCDFYGALLREADLTGVNFTRARLTCAILERACLNGTKFFDADLRCAHLDGAEFSDGTAGLVAISPIGMHGGTLYGVAHVGGPMVKLGDRWNDLRGTREDMDRIYALGGPLACYRPAIFAALTFVEAVL